MAQQLIRTLGLKDLIMIVIGTVIGSGIFIVPAVVLHQTAGSIGLALLVWAIAGALSFLGALTYAELGAMAPEAGGIYVYIREAFGSLPAFLYGWTLFFVMGNASIATLAVAFAGYLHELVPLSSIARHVAAILMIVVVPPSTFAARAKAPTCRIGRRVKVGALIIMSVMLLGIGKGFSQTSGSFWPNTLEWSLLPGIGLAMIGVLWAYEGWQYVTYSAGEAINPQRTFAAGIALGTVALIAIYLLANIAYLAALGPQAASRSERIAAEAVGATMGPAAGKLIAAAILVSMFSAANAVMLTSSRVYFRMARDGVFFKRFAEIHPRLGTPAMAIGWSAVCAVAFAASGTFEQLLTYVIFAGWLFYALGAMSIFVYRRRHPEAPRPFRVPGYPWTPDSLHYLSGCDSRQYADFTTLPRPGWDCHRVARRTGIFYLESPAAARTGRCLEFEFCKLLLNAKFS
jgi:APA family basic amino acid/polyamine antiporter